MTLTTTAPRKPNRLGEVSASFVEVLLRTVDSQGHDAFGLEKLFKLNKISLGSSNARISIPKFMRLGHAAIQLTGCETFGLSMGRQLHVSDYGIVGFASLCAPTLREALQTLIDYEVLLGRNSRGESSHYMEDQRQIFEFYSISPYNEYNYFVVDLTLASWYAYATWLCGEQDFLEKVEIEYRPPLDTQTYEEFFQCPVYFGAVRNALTFKKSKEQLSNLYHSKHNYDSAKMRCDAEKSALSENRLLTDQVAQLITQKLASGTATLQDISSTLKLSPWTLRRRLENEGYNFQKLLDQTRRSLALDYVAHTAYNFTEIAYLLGFSTPEAFQRAFKRWSNVSPGAYRKQDTNIGEG